MGERIMCLSEQEACHGRLLHKSPQQLRLVRSDPDNMFEIEQAQARASGG